MENPEQQSIKSEEKSEQRHEVDVETCFQMGDYVPLTILLQNKQIDINDQFQMGFTLLHYCALFDLKEYAQYLLHNYRDDIDLNSTNEQKQTPLMMAVDQNHLEMVQILLENGAQPNCKDNMEYNCLIYAIKNDNYLLFFILLHYGADINHTDINGSGIQHWAAYKNNVNLLRFCKRLNIDLLEQDKKQESPLKKAIMNTSYQAIEYLANEYPEQINSALYNSTNSPSIKIILDKIKNKHDKTTKWNQLLSSFEQCRPLYVGLFYTSMTLMLLFAYLRNPASEYNYSICTGFFVLLTFYGLMFSYWFMKNIPCATESDVSTRFLAPESLRGQEYAEPIPPYLKNIDVNQFTYINFDNIDQLFEKNSDINSKGLNDSHDEESHSQQHQTIGLFNNEEICSTFIHQLVVLFEDKQLERLKNIDYSRFCYSCLKYKNQQTVHCAITDKCVKEYQYYSYFFGKCINISNHFFYLFVQILSQIIMSVFYGLIMNYTLSIRESNFYFIYFETFYIFWDKGYINFCLFYILLSVLYFYNSIFLCIEFYGFTKQLTYREVLFPHRYRYLYEPIEEKKGTFEKTVNILKLNNKSLVEIGKNYIMKTLTHARIRI